MILKDKETGRCTDICCILLLYGTRTSPYVPSSMQFWNTTAKLHKPCRGANFPGCISLSGTAYSCFIVISPFVAVRNIPIWAKMDSSRRTGNIPSSWYKRWRWTQFATAIIVSKGNGDMLLSRYMLHLIAHRDTDLNLCPLQLFQAADEVVCCEWMDLP